MLFPDPPQQMNLVAATHPEPLAGALEVDPRGQQDRLAEPTSTANASGQPASAARQRAFVHIPWAIARGKPNAFAVKACRWIGLWSPDTEA